MNIGDDEHNALAEADLKRLWTYQATKQKDNIMWLR